MATHGAPPNRAGRRRLAVAVGAGVGLTLALLLAIPAATGASWDILDRLRSSSSATPQPGPTAKPAADRTPPATPLMKACIEQTKGQDVYGFYLRDIPQGRWGEPVSGTLSTFDKPHTLWLFDADCKPYKAVTVPARSNRPFEAYVGQVWYWADASAKQPTDDYASGVVSPSHFRSDQIFNNTGRLTYDTE